MKYELKLSPDFPAARRVRAGIEVPRGRGIQVELTEAQFKALDADPEIVVTPVKQAAKPASKTPESKTPSVNTKTMVDKQEEKTA